MTADEAEAYYKGLAIQGMEDRRAMRVVPVDWAVVAKNRTGYRSDEPIPLDSDHWLPPFIPEPPLRVLSDGIVVRDEDYRAWRKARRDPHLQPLQFSPTMNLRWVVCVTPGERPVLQQLWRCDAEGAAARGWPIQEEWRNVKFFDYLGQPV